MIAPAVSVIVPHYADLDSLGRCLEALERQTYPRSAFEIVVADNDSPQGVAAVEAVLARRARLVVVGQRGAGAARNGGVASSDGRLLAFTDCDCVPEPDWLARGVAALDVFDVVGGRMRVLVGDANRVTAVEAFETLFAFDNETYVKRKGFTVSANLFCTRDIFDRVGGFVTSVVSEDREWCLRAATMGLRIGYARESVVGHPARRTWPELVRKARRINAESFGLERLRAGGRARWLVRTLALPLSALAHTPKALFKPAPLSLARRGAAVVILVRLRLWRLLDGLRLLATSG